MPKIIILKKKPLFNSLGVEGLTDGQKVPRKKFQSYFFYVKNLKKFSKKNVGELFLTFNSNPFAALTVNFSTSIVSCEIGQLVVRSVPRIQR